MEHRFAIALVLLLGACSAEPAAEDPSCTPGQQVACDCPGGAPSGVQICDSSGKSFGACSCGAPGGSGGGWPGSGGSAGTAGSAGGAAGSPGSGGAAGAGSGGSGAEPGSPSGPPQAVPPAGPPDGYPVVAQVATDHPDWLAASCVEQGGNNEFLFEVVRRLRQLDDRWGLNWKRGVVGDLSQDVVDYHYGEGPSENSTDVYIIDMITGHCGDAPSAGWIDVTQATLDKNEIGRFTLAGNPTL